MRAIFILNFTHIMDLIFNAYFFVLLILLKCIVTNKNFNRQLRFPTNPLFHYLSSLSS